MRCALRKASATDVVNAEPRHQRILVWMCVLVAINQLGFGGIVPALALYARSFGVGQSAIGLAIAIYGLARFVVGVPVGQYADRAGRRAALATGGLVTAAGNLMCAYAPTYATFVMARFVAGAGAAFVLTTGLIVLADITEPSRRGRTMSIYQGVFLFAVGVGPLPGGLLAERFGLAAPFVAYAAAGALASLVAWFQIPETRHAAMSRRDGGAAAAPAFSTQVRLMTGRIGFVLVGVISFMVVVARTGGLFNVIPVLARDRLALTTDRIGFGLALASLVGLALTYPAGVLVDRYGRKAVIVPSTLVSGVSLVLFLLAPSYAWFLAGCVAWSVATGISGAAPAAYAADVAPAGMNAAAMSTYRAVSDLGYVVGPIALGAITDVFGARTALAITAVMLGIAALVFAQFAPESYRSRMPAAS
jgi:MFS family permease